MSILSSIVTLLNLADIYWHILFNRGIYHKCSTHAVLHFGINTHAVLGIKDQGDGVSKTHSNETSVQRTSKGDVGEDHSCQEQGGYEVDSYCKPSSGHQVEVNP